MPIEPIPSAPSWTPVPPLATYASRLTAAGRSAVAVIGLRGTDAGACVQACFNPARERAYSTGQIRYGLWSSPNESSDGADGESIVITPVADDEFEIHAHGGSAAVKRILDTLQLHGVTVVDADHYAAQKTDRLLRLEAESVLTRCTTPRNAALALEQCRCGLEAWVDDQLINPVDLNTLQDSVRRILNWDSLGKHLVEPYRVVLAGPANVGKSSLINRVVGYGRTITHDAPGTTRDVIDCETVIDGVAIRLSDTAGIREGGGEIEREGIRRGAIAIGDADLVVLVVSPLCLGELSSLRANVQKIAPQSLKIEVLNQVDRLDETQTRVDCDLPAIQTIALEPSSDNDLVDGIEQLMLAIIDRLRPVDPPRGQPIPLSPRQSNLLRKIVESTQLDYVSKLLRALKSGSL